MIRVNNDIYVPLDALAQAFQDIIDDLETTEDEDLHTNDSLMEVAQKSGYSLKTTKIITMEVMKYLRDTHRNIERDMLEVSEEAVEQAKAQIEESLEKVAKAHLN